MTVKEHGPADSRLAMDTSLVNFLAKEMGADATRVRASLLRELTKVAQAAGHLGATATWEDGLTLRDARGDRLDADTFLDAAAERVQSAPPDPSEGQSRR